MSLYGSMYTGITGLSGNSQRFATISDNIANVSTTGYKASRMAFENMVVAAGTQHSYIPGGTLTSVRHEISRQGQIQGTVSATDLAISGQGFFVVKDDLSTDLPEYTRAGSFTVDAEGYLRNVSGKYLQAYPLDANGALPSDTSMSGLTSVNLTRIVGSATPTSRVNFNINLPADAGTRFATTPLTTSLNVYDGLGAAHRLAIDWTSDDSATGVWTGTIRQDDGTASGTFTVAFNPDGSYQLSPTDDGTRPFTLDLTGNFGATDPAQQISLNFADITSYAGDYEVAKIDQNGTPVGKLAGVTVTDTGTVQLMFTNGAMRNAYRIPLATFPNVDGLTPESGGVFQQSLYSGNPSVVFAKTAGAGTIVAESLETSTVDIAQELTDMIMTQNAYTSNVKVITTADQMMQELNRIKQ